MHRLLAAGVLLIIVLAQACAGGKPAALRGGLLDADVTPTQSIADLTCPPQTDPAVWEQLKAALASALSGMPEARRASGVPSAAAGAVQDFALTPQDDETLLCTWTYRNTGDYDQNGIAEAADLAPIGLHFGATSADEDWAAAQLADGDGNGEVNISDVTPIARNWQARIDGYFVQQTQTPDEPPSWNSIANVQFEDAVSPQDGSPRQFAHVGQVPLPGYYYRVVSYSLAGGNLATGYPSSVAQFELPVPATPTGLHVIETQQMGGISLAWDAAAWAAKYTVYRDNQDAPYVSVGGVSAWSDTAVYDSHQHTYWVQAVNDAGASALSQPGSGALSTGPQRDEWYMAFHDSRHSGTSPFIGPQIPIRKWIYAPSDPPPGPGYLPVLLGPPSVANDGIVYATLKFRSDKSQYDDASALLAFNADGTVYWQADLPKAAAQGAAIGQDGVIYVSTNPIFTSGALHAFGADGNQVWTLGQGGNAMAPAIGPDDSIYPGCLSSAESTYGWASIKADSSISWICEEIGWTTKSVAAVGWNGTLYVCNMISPFAPALSECVAVEPTNGAVKWKFEYPSAAVCSLCITPDGMIVFTSGDEDLLYALRPDGTQLWQMNLSVSTEASPIATPDGSIYCGSTNGSLYKIDSQGSIVWSFPVGGTLSEASAVLDGAGTVYIGSTSGTFWAINPDGTEKWSYDARIDPNDYINSSAAIGPDGTIYVVTNMGVLHAIGEAGS